METVHQLYLDYAAATPVHEQVLLAMAPYYTERFFNPSSPYVGAVEVRREYEDAKARLTATFGGKADEIIITSGATESINLACAGMNGHIVSDTIEHPAVIEAIKRSNEHTFVAPTEKGIITPEAVQAAILPNTWLVSVQLANNEIGTIQPLRAIAQIVAAERQARAEQGNTTPLFLHSDASQGFGAIDVHVARLGVDMLTLNSGKIYGPKGVGLLWVKPGVVLKPLIVGGGQERGLRSGTENVPGVIGFAAAAELAHKTQKGEQARLTSLRDMLQKKLQQAFPEMVVSGHAKKRLPGHLHLAFAGIDGERIVYLLEREGIYVATGSACAANKGTRSHVLEAIGMSPEVADGSLRITLGRSTTEADITRAASAITAAVAGEYKRMESR